MFFVTLLLNAVLAWMRGQSGTTSLRALLYMDEIFGYFPPTAEPPSKKPLLTLLKQARAFGLGVAAGDPEPRRPRLQGPLERRHLADRAPADRPGQAARARRARGRLGPGRARSRAAREADLRARQSRLPAQQRARERARGVPDALDDVVPARAAVAAADRRADGAAQGGAAGTGGRARRGRRRLRLAAAAAAAPAAGRCCAGVRGGHAARRPERRLAGVPAAARRRPRRRIAGLRPDAARRRARAPARHQERRSTRRSRTPGWRRSPTARSPIDWSSCRGLAIAVADLESTPREGCAFHELPARRARGQGLRALVEGLRGLAVPDADGDAPAQQVAEARLAHGESEADFRARLAQGAREGRDSKADALRAKYDAKVAALQQKLHTAQQAVDREENQERGAGLQTAVSVAGSILGGFLGRKSVSVGSITTRRARRRAAWRSSTTTSSAPRRTSSACRPSWRAARRRSRRTRRAWARTARRPSSSTPC